MEATGRQPPAEDRYIFRRGHRLEQAMAEELIHEGHKVQMFPQNTLLRSAEHPWMTVTPDATRFDEHGQEINHVELKAPVSQYVMTEWREAAEREEVPIYVEAQIQWSMLVTGFSTAYVAADLLTELLHGEIEAKPFVQEELMRRADQIRQCIQRDTPPDFDWIDPDDETLNKLFPSAKGTSTVLPKGMVQKWLDAKANRLKWQKLEKTRAALMKLRALSQVGLRGDISDEIADGYELIIHSDALDGEVIKWSTSPRKAYEVKAGRTVRFQTIKEKK
jgi:hypothetical protein